LWDVTVLSSSSTDQNTQIYIVSIFVVFVVCYLGAVIIVICVLDFDFVYASV